MKNSSNNSFSISTQPNADFIWANSGTGFANICQVLNELVDDSYSNYLAVPSVHNNILITITDNGAGNDVEITVEDAGSGIEDLDAAFTLAGVGGKRTVLNEHGHGLKHALSSANPGNDAWEVDTRTAEDEKLNRYKQIAAPYRIGNNALSGEYKVGWVGKLGNTGTVFKFKCGYNMFMSATKGMRSKKSKNFDTIVSVIIEELGFVYARPLMNGELSIQIVTDSSSKTPIPVRPILPKWDTEYAYTDDTTTIDLGVGAVDVEFEYGRILVDTINLKHYIGNMSSSGAEIAINGRVIESNIFKDIWNIERHPSQNHFILRVNLKTNNPHALPKTRCTKNGFCQGDPKLDNLYAWIRKMVPEPAKEVRLAHSEKELFERLAAAKRIHLRPPVIVETEFPIFTSFDERVRADLYVSENGYTSIFEGKKNTTTPKDVFQLLMYINGSVIDGRIPDEGILVGSNHPESVLKILDFINGTQGPANITYNLKAKTWRELGIDYPAAP